MITFIARIMRIMPPKISRILGLSLLKNCPVKKPIIEFVKVTSPIKIIAGIIFVRFNDSVIPAENASILVATAIMNNVERVKSFEDVFGSKDSFMKFIPR